MNTKLLILLAALAPAGFHAVADETVAENVAVEEVADVTVSEEPQAGEATAEAGDSEREALLQALRAAIPFAEAGITVDRSCLAAPLDKVDLTAVNNRIDAVAPLVPYSDKIKSYADMLRQFKDISQAFANCREFDTKPYSMAMVDSVQGVLLNIYETGEEILSPSQKDGINALYERAGAYQLAVATFDSLLKAVDDEIDMFRAKDDGDKLCANEIERILKEREADIAAIKEYRYLSQLIDRYSKELSDSPRSLTPDIRDELARMKSEE